MDIKLQSQIQSLKNVSDLYNILADKYEVSPEFIKAVTDYPYDYIARVIRSRSGDNILLHNLGNFQLDLYAVNKKIRKVLSAYRKKTLDREKTVNEITMLWELRNKAMDYKENSKR